MMEADNCQKFLELALGVSIGRVEISREKSLVYHPEYKGVRLDVFARDERASSFNVEMQMVSRPSLENVPDSIMLIWIWNFWFPEQITRNCPMPA